MSPQVEVEVNGTPVDVNMKVDETGRGFFVQPRMTPEVCMFVPHSY